MSGVRLDTVAVDVPADTADEQVPEACLWCHAPPRLPIVSVAVVAPIEPAVSVSSAGCVASEASESALSPVAFTARTLYR